MKYLHLIFLSIYYWLAPAIKIYIKNDLARDLFPSSFYLPSGGITYSPPYILSGEEEILEIDDEDLIFSNNITGMIILKPQGSSSVPIALAWQIPTDDMIVGSNNTISIYSGNFTNLSEHFLMVTNSSSNSTHYARDGWFTVNFQDGTLARIFMASDSTPTIYVNFDENIRIPTGEFYLQAMNTSYFLYRLNTTATTLEYLIPDEDLNFRWKITKRTDGNFIIIPSGAQTQPLFAYHSNAFNTNSSINSIPTIGTSTTEEQLGYFWKIKHAKNDLFVIMSIRYYNKNIDFSKCRNGGLTINTNLITKCSLSSFVGLVDGLNYENQNSQRLWRLIPL